MEYEIHGAFIPIIELKLHKGEHIYAQSGVMRWMDSDIAMKVRYKEGFMHNIKRALGAGDIAMVDYTAEREGASVVFGHTYPSKIIVIDLKTTSLICQKRSFLCATADIDYESYIEEKISPGIFGSDGLVMDKFKGRGWLIIEMDGQCIERELEEGESIKVDPASVGAFQETVTFSTERFSSGFPSKFSGEGGSIFISTLKGPGKVWLQTMPVQSMVGEMSKYLPLRPDPR